MAQPARTKIVVSCPTGSNRFVVGGGSELRLYEWEHTSTHSRFNHLGGTSELGQLRTFAWSPHTAFPDLVAVGLHAGRILLLRLDSSPAATRAHQHGNPPSAVQINIRHSRPCNVVAFSQAEPGLLAVGLEKGRGESLLIYDVEHSARAIESGKDLSNTPSTKPFILQRDGGASHSNSPSGNLEPSPLLSFGSSETVTAAAFLSTSTTSSSSPLLAAAMAGKWLRTYDLRSPPATVSTWGTRAVHCLAPNPFNSQQFASSGEDGIVRLWDLRRPMDALLSFSEVDAGAVSARTRPTIVAKPLVEMKWDHTRKGILTTLERDSHALRVWQLEEGPTAKLEGGAGEGGTADHQAYEGHAQTAAAADGLRMPVVLGDRRPRNFQHPLTSFAFLPSPLDPTSTHFLGVSRDTSSPGTSGHRLEVIELPPTQHSAFLDRGLLVSSDAAPSGFSTFHIEPPPPEVPVTGDEVESPEGLKANRILLARGRTLSLNVASLPAFDRNRTPRPSGSVTPRRLSRSGDTQAGPAEQDVLSRSGLAALSTDVSVLMRQRVEKGCGSDALANASLCDASISEMWSWIARAEALSKDACLNDYDFRYRGVIPILLGFHSCSYRDASASSTHSSTPHHSPKSTSRTIYSDITRSLRKGDEAQTKNAAYSAAASALVQRRKIDGTFAISSSSFASQRKLALQSCGADWEDDYEAVCQRFIKEDNYEAAARHAFFSGHLEKAMSYLKSCKEENVRMLAPILAAYIAQRDLKGTDSAYADLCRSLSSDGDTPWIRAMFAFLASGDWRELVDETGLPLRDRVAVALRFLSDSELLPFLQDLGNEALSTGDPEAIVLFGLRGDGLKLLSNFLDRTADVQTVALAVSFVFPGILRSDRRVERWIQTYRSALDGLQLYASRAVFDSAQGRRARVAMEQARMSGRHNEAVEVDKALKKAAPPQMVVRCQFCSTNIAPAAQPLSLRGGDRGVVGSLGVKSTLCPTCSKSLPACAICLTKPSIHSFAADGSSNLCWCQKCRHGGHIMHVLEWFERSEVCAVADCDCRCRDS